MNYRVKANLTLAIVFFLFLFTTAFRHLYPLAPGLSLASYVMETALIGGIADWFAVTALFQKPLGWPFHTALIPRNRAKVIESIGNMVQNDLLNLEHIRQKITEIRLTPGLIRWVEDSGGPGRMLGALLSGENMLQALAAKPGDYLARKLRAFLEKQDISPLVLRLLVYLRDDEERWFAYLLDKLQAWAAAEQTRENLYNFLEEQKKAKLGKSSLGKYLFNFMEKLDGINLEEAAGTLQMELCLTIMGLKEQKNPLRQKINQQLSMIIAEAEPSPEGWNALEGWKNNVLAGLPWENIFAGLVQTLQSSALTPSGTDPGKTVLAEWLNEQAENYWASFRSNTALQDKLDLFCQSLLYRLSRTEHDLIGKIARDTLESLSDKDLAEFVQDKAGNDLQWIRINGSLIGGVIGLILFILLNYVYTPLLIK